MGSCWNCGTAVFLKEEETCCSRCGEILRYWCNGCKIPFDIEDKKTKKKLIECKWCKYFICPHCGTCTGDCQKYTHENKVKEIVKPVVAIDKWNLLDEKACKIVAYFEDIKFNLDRKECEFGVSKTYAKERIKYTLARMMGYKVKNKQDQEAFVKRQEEVLYEELGKEFTINNSRDNGTYGQEYRDVFNLCVCLGKLKYERKHFTNKKGEEIGYDSWTRIDDKLCPYFDIDKIIYKRCPKCKEIFGRDKEFCNNCKHKDDTPFKLIEKIANNPTCKNVLNFTKEGDKNGEGKSKFN